MATRSDSRLTCHVIVAYQAAYPDPLVVRAGEELTVGEKDSEWEGWLWCTDAAGKSGWVPEGYVERRGARCTAIVDYDGTELSVRVGEELLGGSEESGWIWCTNQAGQSGWVPAEHVSCEAGDR